MRAWHKPPRCDRGYSACSAARWPTSTPPYVDFSSRSPPARFWPPLSAAAHAQQVFTFNTDYKATGLSQWDTGNASGISWSLNLGASYSASASFGGFSTGLFGDVWGAGGTASVNVAAGFNVSFATNGGSVDVNLPNKIKLIVPSDNAVAVPTIAITQDRSALGSGSIFTSTFPSISFGLGAYYNIDAHVTGTVAYGVGSASGTIDLLDLFAIANPALAAQFILSGTTPFAADYNHLLAYNGATSQLTIANNTVSIASGYTKILTTSDFVTVGGHEIPTINKIGTITVNPTTTASSTHGLRQQPRLPPTRRPPSSAPRSTCSGRSRRPSTSRSIPSTSTAPSRARPSTSAPRSCPWIRTSTSASSRP